jgi:hypothetical protein
VSDTNFASIIVFQLKGKGSTTRIHHSISTEWQGFTQIVQISPPPPAPNIPQNPDRLHNMILADYQEAAFSIAQKPTKVEGKYKMQAIAIETPHTRDGRMKHYFVKSEQIGFK